LYIFLIKVTSLRKCYEEGMVASICKTIIG